jgi:hypothetical protein
MPVFLLGIKFQPSLQPATITKYVNNNLNYWVMHPVARVSIKYWINIRMQQSFFCAKFYCALLTLRTEVIPIFKC